MFGIDTLELGSVADWFSGAGSIGAVAVALYFGVHELRRARRGEEERELRKIERARREDEQREIERLSKQAVLGELKRLLAEAKKEASEFAAAMRLRRGSDWTKPAIAFIDSMQSTGALLVDIQEAATREPEIVSAAGGIARRLRRSMMVATNGPEDFAEHAENLQQAIERTNDYIETLQSALGTATPLEPDEPTSR